MSIAQDNTPSIHEIHRVGIFGHGYVGSGMSHAMGAMVEVAYHDPALPESKPPERLIEWADALFICVPTPQGPTGAADVSVVQAVMADLAARRATLPILLKSTVPPGTCADIAARWPELQLVFNPEFLRERHHLEDAASPARVVLGWTSSVGPVDQARVRDLFRRRFADTPIVEMAAGEAELLKYASNALFGVKVSFANEMDELARKLGVSWEPVRKALVLDPRVGDGHLTVPGLDGKVGFGGSCLPKDMAAILAVAEDAGIELAVVDAAVRSNQKRRK